MTPTFPVQAENVVSAVGQVEIVVVLVAPEVAVQVDLVAVVLADLVAVDPVVVDLVVLAAEPLTNQQPPRLPPQPQQLSKLPSLIPFQSTSS